LFALLPVNRDWVTTSTLAHISGVILSLAFIQCGVPFIVMESFDADAVLESVERRRCKMDMRRGSPFRKLGRCNKAGRF
jgi:hypothetical protein